MATNFVSYASDTGVVQFDPTVVLDPVIHGAVNAIAFGLVLWVGISGIRYILTFLRDPDHGAIAWGEDDDDHEGAGLSYKEMQDMWGGAYRERRAYGYYNPDAGPKGPLP